MAVSRYRSHPRRPVIAENKSSAFSVDQIDEPVKVSQYPLSFLVVPAELHSDNPPRPNWYILYILKSLLFIQNACPILLKSMDGYANGFEERVLNTVWIGLLGIEVLMVLGVAVQGVIKRFGPQPKQRTA